MVGSTMGDGPIQEVTMKIWKKQYLLALCMVAMSLLYAYDVVELPNPWGTVASVFFLLLAIINLVLGHLNCSRDV